PSERNMTPKTVLSALIVPILFAGCSSTKTITVEVPPRVDLRAYPTVGLVAFTSNANGDLERMATQKFLQSVQSAQPGTRVVELGSEADVLSSVGRRSWDAATLRAVKEAHGVDVVVIGRLELEKAKAGIQLSTVWKSLSARADVICSLNARLIET